MCATPCRPAGVGTFDCTSAEIRTQELMMDPNSFPLQTPSPCRLLLRCFWFSFEGPEMPMVCLTDFEARARKQLSKSTWDYIEGAAGEGFTRDDNVAAFKKFDLLYPFCC